MKQQILLTLILKQSLPYFLIGRLNKPNLQQKHELIKLIAYFGKSKLMQNITFCSDMIEL